MILRATATIFKGYLDSSVTVAFPIPELAPVTKTTLSVQRSILLGIFSSNKNGLLFNLFESFQRNSTTSYLY